MMLSRPVGRAALAAPSKSLCLPQTCSRAATSQASRTSHQRRQSSSKASHPPGPPRGSETATGNGANGSAEHSEQPQNAEPEKKQPTRISRKKAKDASTTAEQRAAMKARDEAFASLPAVPPTSHLHAGDVHTSSFFSLGRPISVTRSFPPEHADAAFNSIFEQRQGHKPKDVIYTVSSAISALDGDSKTRDEKDLRWEILQQSSSNSETRQHQQMQQQTPSLEDLVKQFKPFNTPPAPVPMDEEFCQPQHRQPEPTSQQSEAENKYTTTLTITEHISPSGKPTYSASTGPFVQRESLPFSSRQPFLSRMQTRQEQMDEYWDRRAEGQGQVMYAISVKRQRKLKMKKHKYKKLMRRTRNLRRREGRT